MIRAQLAAIRAQLDALEAAIFARPDEDVTPAGACVHPMDRRENRSTMGVVRWTCLDCGHEHEQVMGG